MEADRAIATAAGQAQLAICRSQARGPSRSVERDLVRAQKWDPLGDVAAGDGMRIGGDLLATAQGLARDRGMATPARSAISRVAPARPTRSGARDCRQLIGARHASGKKTGPNPTDR